jgi:hypothetical protein
VVAEQASVTIREAQKHDEESPKLASYNMREPRVPDDELARQRRHGDAVCGQVRRSRSSLRIPGSSIVEQRAIGADSRMVGSPGSDACCQRCCILTWTQLQVRRSAPTNSESDSTLSVTRRRCFHHLPCVDGTLVLRDDAPRHSSTDRHQHSCAWWILPRTTFGADSCSNRRGPQRFPG